MPKGNQQGRVYEHRGRWYVDFFDSYGRRVRRPTEWSNEASNKRRAERLLRSIIDAVSDGVYKAEDFFGRGPEKRCSSRTFREQGDLWLASKDLKASTLEIYKSRLEANIYPAIGHLKLCDIPPTELGIRMKLLAGEQSGSTKRGLVNVVKAVFESAVRDGVLDAGANPAQFLVRPQHDHRPQLPEDVYSASQIKLIVSSASAALGPGFGNFIAVLAYTGMRPGELCALRWDSVNLEQGHVEVKGTVHRGEITAPKSRAGRRRVELNHLAVEALLAQKKETFGVSEFVFLSLQGKRSWQTVSAPGKHWHRVLSHAQAAATQSGSGMIRRLPMYSLRHSYASICITAGVPLLWLSRQLGHGSTELTEKVYARWLPDQDAGRQREKFVAAMQSA